MLLIYTPNITPRIEYIMHYVFEEQLGINYTVCDNENDFTNIAADAKIVYATKNISAGIYFFACDILFENDIKEVDIKSGEINNTIVLFKHNRKDILGFDVFAAAFYLISRYEEYLNKPTDKFGNYDFKNSILHQLNCMHIAVVERWINMLKEALAKHFSLLQFKQNVPGFALSFDIDVAFEYSNRSAARTIGGIVKKVGGFKFSSLKDQLLTIAHLRKDMFDTYDYIFNKIKHNRAIFFFNMGSYARYDKNPSHKNKAFRALIKRIHAKHITGLHPSFASNSNYSLITSEKNWLEEIVNEKITNSRQHYLKLKFPDTYNTLIENELKNDYTIGYHDTYGFRAGTCNSFLFFDLKKNQKTNLRLFPFAVMEGTLDDVMNLEVEASKKIISDLIYEVCKYNGVFISLWHNSTLSTKNRREIFEYMLNEIERRSLVNILK